MTDGVVLTLSSEYRVCADAHQWILERRTEPRKALTRERWYPVAYVGGLKSTLVRVAKEEGCQISTGAQSILDRWPERFLDWVKKPEKFIEIAERGAAIGAGGGAVSISAQGDGNAPGSAISPTLSAVSPTLKAVSPSGEGEGGGGVESGVAPLETRAAQAGLVETAVDERVAAIGGEVLHTATTASPDSRSSARPAPDSPEDLLYIPECLRRTA